MPDSDFSSANQISATEIDQDSPLTEGLFTKIKNRNIEAMELTKKALLFGGDGRDGAVTVSSDTTWDALMSSLGITDGILRCTTFTIDAGITLKAGVIEQNGDISNGSLIVANLSDTSGLTVNQRLSVSADVLEGNYIDTIDSATQITMKNQAATATGTRTFTFYKQQRLIILASESITINGTIDCNGAGVQGAMRGFGSNSTGNNGTDGDIGGGGGAGESEGSTAGNGGKGFELDGGGSAGSASQGAGGNIVPYAKYVINTNNILSYTGGGSGGAGGNSGTDNPRNFGGNAGGAVYLESPVITIAAAGDISADGLIGGDGNNPGAAQTAPQAAAVVDWSY